MKVVTNMDTLYDVILLIDMDEVVNDAVEITQPYVKKGNRYLMYERVTDERLTSYKRFKGVTVLASKQYMRGADVSQKLFMQIFKDPEMKDQFDSVSPPTIEDPETGEQVERSQMFGKIA